MSVNFPTPQARVVEYEKLGLGMFVHYGLYSQLNKGEWIYWMTDRDMDKYQKLKDSFTAEDFDAEKIVLTAKACGCRYVNLTTRHHEGFSLYDTCKLSDFDSLHSPCGRDLVREFVDACNKHGIVPFFYHTTWDWYNKDFDNDFNKYLEYLRSSVEILCKNYGKIGGFYFDGNWIKPKADWKLDELYGTIRKYQPDAIIINNTGLHNLGKAIHPEIDAVTFEQTIPVTIDRDGLKHYYAGEMDLTMNTHWGIAPGDINYKSPKELIEALCRCRATGNNLLLNISPTATGGILPYQAALFGIIGEWIDIFGEAIYDTTPLHYPENVGGYTNNKMVISRDRKNLFIFAFDHGKNGDSNVTVGGKYAGLTSFSNVKFRVKKAYWMDNGEDIDFSQDKFDNLCVNLTGYKYGCDYCVRVAKLELE